MIQPGQNNSKTAWISPTTQQLFQFDFSSLTEDYVLLKVISNVETPVCSLVSVQPLENCLDELYDEEKDMRYGNNTVFQTMLSVTAIVIERKTYPKGINIVMLSKSSNSECYLKTQPNDNNSNRSMNVAVSVEKLEEDPVTSTLIVVVTYITLGMTVSVFSFVSFRRFGLEFDSKFGTYEMKLELTLSKRKKDGIKEKEYLVEKVSMIY